MEQNSIKTNINRLIAVYLTPSAKPYFIRNYENLDDDNLSKKQ